jgi:glycerol-3-phosphate acyltransferase PlsY
LREVSLGSIASGILLARPLARRRIRIQSRRTNGSESSLRTLSEFPAISSSFGSKFRCRAMIFSAF